MLLILVSLGLGIFYLGALISYIHSWKKDSAQISDREHLFIFFAPCIFAVLIFASVSNIKHELECREVARNGTF